MVKTLKTYIKIKGEDRDKAIDELEGLGYGMPEVCILDTKLLDRVSGEFPDWVSAGPAMTDWAVGYFGRLQGIDPTPERCSKIVSTSEPDLEGYDFMFEWFEEPEEGQVKQLEDDISNALDDLDVEYEIETK